MPTKAALTEEEYLRTSFPDLDREFRNGEVIERAMPDWFHCNAQLEFSIFFGTRRKTLSIDVVPEYRVRLRPGRHVLPDIAVYWPAEPKGSVPDRLPLIAIEILSDDDTMKDVRDKLEEYKSAGVAHIWLVDPRRKLFYLFDGQLNEVKSYTIPELGLTVTPAEIFA